MTHGFNFLYVNFFC
ncbi:hypothetical protein GJ686_24720 [Klebsiella variicola]|nr:hypothetical protein [Klebsiella variicola]MUM57770.1 hypothetical protein [Klebsiella variicola]